jgi:uncharacterized protein
MAASEENLCTSCGLCCDGSLFAEVELGSRRESFSVESMGLDVDESDEDNRTPILNQPCAALKTRRCTVYKFRPGCCRTFECRLLQQAKAGAISFDNAKTQVADVLREIRKIKTLLGSFPSASGDRSLPLKERCQQALAHSGSATADLEVAMSALDRVLRKTFLV